MNEANKLYLRSLGIYQDALGPLHPVVAKILINLAAIYSLQGRLNDAKKLYQRSLEIYRGTLGPRHPLVAKSLNNLGSLYEYLGEYSKAEPLYKRSLAIIEKAHGRDHPDVARSLNKLAGLYMYQLRYEEAEQLIKRSLDIWEKTLGPEHPNAGTSLANYATLLPNTGRVAEAAKMGARAPAILARHAKSLPSNIVTTAANNFVKITSSRKQGEVGSTIIVRGTVVFADEDNTDPIWVFARRVDFTDIWRPQQKPRVKRQGKSAEWSAVTSIGAPYDVAMILRSWRQP